MQLGILKNPGVTKNPKIPIIPFKVVAKHIEDRLPTKTIVAVLCANKSQKTTPYIVVSVNYCPNDIEFNKFYLKNMLPGKNLNIFLQVIILR